MDRRGFLKTTSVAGILAAGRAPAFAQGTKLHLLRWVDFVPAGDQILRQQLLPDAGKALGVEVQLETINANDLQPRITAAIQSGSGADIIMTLHNWPHLYKSSVVDVTDVAEGIAKDQGGFYAQAEQAVKDGKQYLAVPFGVNGLLIAYRKSWFKEAGAETPPKTLDEYRQLGTRLKKKGHPIGQTLGHTFGDAPARSYPMLWNFGAAERDRQGKTKLDSKETVESVKWMTAFWKDLFRWLRAKDQFAKWFEVMEGFSAGSTKYWERNPLWGRLDDAMKLYRTAAQASRIIGWEGAPDAKASEVYSKYVVTDMYAKAAQGLAPADAAKWAAAELQKIYG